MLKRSFIWFAVSALALLALCMIIYARQHGDAAKNIVTACAQSECRNVNYSKGGRESEHTLVGSLLLTECKYSLHGVDEDALNMLKEHSTASEGLFQAAQIASDKNQVMDALLGQSQIPADYGETMIALFRDPAQDVVTRDFAVQHIGLYAQALNRRGQYNVDSADAANCRNALFDAASETSTIVAAAAFRALADVSEFDPRIDARRLDNALVRCASDDTASLAVRVMAVQLCGERNVKSSESAIKTILDAKSAPEPLRRAASHALKLLDGNVP